jgi:branched-chain amino acid transport system ATP-binding protein
MLEIEGVTARYKGIVALDKVSLTVREGEIHGVIGPNGAGKSTLMEAITGGKKISEGTITFQGIDITRKSVAWRRHAGVARSFQRTSIFPDLTVGEQLRLAASRFADSGLDEVIDALDLRALLGARASAVAYGEQRRIDLGLALMGHAKLVVMDEPAAGLSSAETADVFEHMARLVLERGATALVVEHDIEAVFSACATVTCLDLGRVLASGTPAEVRSDPAVITAYLGTAA